MKTRVYVDTSVIGGCEDDEFRDPSRRILQRFVRGEFVLVLSDLTLQELAQAPPAVRSHLAAVPEQHLEVLHLDSESEDLAQAYVASGALSAAMLADGQHIAMASAARVDVLVSWNFKHIVNLFRIRALNSVNLLRGYPLLEIRTPSEVVPDE